jgi:hypothetical protein
MKKPFAVKLFAVALFAFAIATQAQAPAGNIEVTPLRLNFGSLPVGQTSTAKRFLIEFSGAPGTAATIVSNNPQFSVVPSNCGLVDGGSCTAEVLFTPSAEGPRSGVITITNMLNNQSIGVNVSGTGTN